ncbi:MAG TPA: nitrilase-related carbon-nitrogen hydrolase [Anaerolineales bacterium]|nr:nitrilase-related carbon-nitrogen hydrolase [Anaerolineales bacterium]
MNNKNLRFLWLGIATTLLLFAGGRWNFPLATWLVPVFAIRFFRDSEKAGRNFLLLWVATAIPIIISWNGATFMYFMNPAVEAAFFLLTAPIGLIPYVMDRLYHSRFGSSFWITLVYPIVATAMDFFSSSGSPFGTFGAIGYSQRDVLPIMQIASVTGLWGITFVMSWFASLVNYVWESGFKLNRLALASACVLVLILGLGFGRTLLSPQPEQTAQIAGFSLPNGKLSEVMGQLQAGDETGFRQTVDELHAQELNEIRRLAQQGAEIVTLQEGAGMGYQDQVENLLTEAGIIAKEQQIYIVLPTVTVGNEKPENVVHIINPNGEPVLKHIKYGGTQFEGSLTGSGELQTVDTPYGKISAIICWDADFPNVVKQAGIQDVDLLFVPSNDWAAVKDIHAGMATFRAVENGMSIYRQTGSGVSIVTDAFGRTLSRVDATKEADTGSFAAIQMVTTPISSVATVYPIIGDVFGNVMMAASAGLLIGLLLNRKRAMARVEAGTVSA